MYRLADFQIRKICNRRQLDCHLMSFCYNVKFNLGGLLDTLTSPLLNCLLNGVVFKPPSSAQRDTLCVSSLVNVVVTRLCG